MEEDFIEPLDLADVQKVLQKGGPLSANDPFYEERPSQILLLKQISAALNEGKIGVFEAGTGVGKSYAYLIPAIKWAMKNGQRIVISTGTINLQQQLAEKDVPKALELTKSSLKFLLMKGRQNYVCRRRLSDLVNEKDLFTEEVDELDKIIEWVKITQDGSRSDLPFMPKEALWQRINSESDACLGNRCPFAEKCFVMKVRKEAASAHILIVNHHLLFSDIEARLISGSYDDAAVLPPYKYLIFDEAHGIEKAATSFFSESINRFKILKQINLLYRQRKSSAAGLLFTLDALSVSAVEMPDIVSAIEETKAALDKVDQIAVETLGNETSWRLYEKTAYEAKPLLVAIDELKIAVAGFTNMLRTVLESVPDENKDAPAVWESKQILHRIEGVLKVCQDFNQWDEKGDNVFFLEKKRLSNGTVYANCVETPLDIAPKMNSGIFEPMDSVICTSATLKTGKDFSYWMHQTGVSFVEKERIAQQVFDSPFPYHSNMLFSVPSDAPLPFESSFQPWVEEAVVSLISASGGKALVLFTSFDSLYYACEHARQALSNDGITILRQGEDDRFRLLETFKNDESSVLFATDSFWEGVDVPGKSLSHVILVKLPFTVPTDPVFAARCEALEKRGGAPFMELSVPEAVMHFRQGVGRLMRRSSDWGAVTVLDSRIIRKTYGQIFLNSIQPCQRCFDPLSQVCSRIKRFFIERE
ncbi:MAG: ATP-dependent DNA helicase [Treponemataceae bacterium]|nr:ATP-dependent DNA helicase [Treponemataceae bacterium]